MMSCVMRDTIQNHAFENRKHKSKPSILDIVMNLTSCEPCDAKQNFTVAFCVPPEPRAEQQNSTDNDALLVLFTFHPGESRYDSDSNRPHSPLINCIMKYYTSRLPPKSHSFICMLLVLLPELTALAAPNLAPGAPTKAAAVLRLPDEAETTDNATAAVAEVIKATLIVVTVILLKKRGLINESRGTLTPGVLVIAAIRGSDCGGRAKQYLSNVHREDTWLVFTMTKSSSVRVRKWLLFTRLGCILFPQAV